MDQETEYYKTMVIVAKNQIKNMITVNPCAEPLLQVYKIQF